MWTKTMLCVSVLGLMAGSMGCGDKDSGGGAKDAAQDAVTTADGAAPGDGSVTGDGSARSDGSAAGDATLKDGGDGDAWNSDVCHVTACSGHVYQCGDCLDNDSDGLIDAKDPDCLGPCDNNETGYNTEIPGGNSAPCRQDCYFDQDTGGGNDECEWDHRCDSLQPVEITDCDYSHACSNCDCDGWLATQSQNCLDFCLPITPNGCDCFGCCELRPGEYRFIGSPDCSLANIDACSPCTPVPSCLNECGHCELCLGKTELPPDCTNDDDRCPAEHQPCGLEGDAPCPEGQYCITGCCVQAVQ